MTNIDKWNYYLRDLESPQIFIDWTYYWTIGAALQRRVWYGDYTFSPLFPNLYCMFVANPGVGKSMAARLSGSKILLPMKFLDTAKLKAGVAEKDAWSEVISISADKTTLESLIQQLDQSIRVMTLPPRLDTRTGIEIQEKSHHCSMAVLLSEEMTSMINQKNEGVVDFLNQVYDSQPYTYKTKGSGNNIITNSCVSFLGCTTPDNVKKLMFNGVLQQGFTARCIPLYAPKARHKKSRYYFDDDQKSKFAEVAEHIKALIQLCGEIKYTKEAEDYFDWYYEEPKDTNGISTGPSPMDASRKNFDKRVDDYFGRKKAHIQKLSMVLHCSENADLNDMSLDTLKRAISILERVELQMHHALASSGRNPLYDLTKTIYEDIAKSGKDGLSSMKLKILYGSELDTEKELPQILKYLGEINKIKAEHNNGKLVYVSVGVDRNLDGLVMRDNEEEIIKK